MTHFSFGMRAEERPYHGKRFYFDASFTKENTSKSYKVANAKTLIQVPPPAALEACFG
jgi:hypothetical protein